MITTSTHHMVHSPENVQAMNAFSRRQYDYLLKNGFEMGVDFFVDWRGDITFPVLRFKTLACQAAVSGVDYYDKTILMLRYAPTKVNPRELVEKAWEIFKKARPYLWQRMKEGKIVVTLEHDSNPNVEFANDSAALRFLIESRWNGEPTLG